MKTDPSDILAKRLLGTTGLNVTPICFGTAAIGSMPETFDFEVSEEQALETLRAAFDSPVNYIDTASLYGDGEAERRIGLVLKERGGLPPGYVLETKAGRDPATNNFSGDQIKRSLERSLNLLGLDHVPLVFLHDPEHTTFEQATAPGGPLTVLQDYHEQGVIGHLGVAGGPIDVEIQYIETGAFEVVITHNRYTLLNQSARPLLERADALGVAVINAAPYGSGMLVKGPEDYPRYAYHEAPDDVVERARRLAEICSRYDVPLGAAALQFSLREPRITSTIVGISEPEHVQATVDFARYPIPDELWPRLEPFARTDVDPEAARWSE